MQRIIYVLILHLKARLINTGRNEELRQELRESRKEAIKYSQQFDKSTFKGENFLNKENI